MNPRSTLLLLSTLAFLLTTRAPATTLYLEDFLTNPYTGTPRWTGSRWDGTTLLPATHNTTPHDAGWNSGNPFSTNAGYIYVQHTGASVLSDYLLRTTSAGSINPHVDYQSLYVTWNSNQSAADTAVRRFTIQVDGVWYVASTPTFLVGSTLNFLDFFGSTWNPISATNLSVDTSTVLTFEDLFPDPADVITNLGFLMEDMPAAGGSTRTVRFDNLSMTSGLLWGGAGGTGGSGTWSGTNAWLTGPDSALVGTNWANNQTAIFGHAHDTAAPGTVTVTSNVIVRSLEFYQNADGYVLRGDVAPGGDGVPVRTIQINTATPYRSLYIAPGVDVTLGGDATTGLRIYRTGATSPLHLYGGGTLTIDRNGMVRSEGGGDVVVNDGTTVVVKAGGQFTASRDIIIGSFVNTLDGSSGDANLIIDGGTSLTRTGGVGGDLHIGGPTGTATVTVKNNGVLTTHASATNGVLFHGSGVLNLESGGVLSTRKISKATDATGEAILRFDGGKLIINGAPPSGTFIGADLNHIYVAGGGAIIDTNGFNTSIGTAFKHDPNGPAIDGGLTKLGAGNLTLFGGAANTYNGVITIKQGRLITPSFEELGDAGNDPSNLVLDGGTWEHTGGASTNRGITVTANGGTLAGNTAWRINGQVVGAADSTLFIAGNAWLSGINTATFHGRIDVLSGEFLVRRAASLGSTQGGVTVRSGATFSLDHNGTGGGNFNIADNTYEDDLLLAAGARLRNRGQTALNNTASIYAGDITLEGPGQSLIEVMDNTSGTITLPAPNLTVTGGISGAGGINKTGAGRLTVAGQATYTGKTTVSAGTFALTGGASFSSTWVDILANASFDVSGTNDPYTATGKTISGAGTVHGNITLGQDAVLKPGASSVPDNIATAGDQIGALTFSGNLTLSDDATISLQIAGVADHDFVNVLGDFTAGSATQISVQWLGGYQAVLGDSFDLMDWAGVTWGAAYEDEATLRNHLVLPSFSDSNLYWNTDDFLSDGIIRVAAVPEPSSSLLLATALGALLLRRRRPGQGAAQSASSITR